MSRLPELDGARGLAILMVMLYHFGGYRPASAGGAWLARLQLPTCFGWTGVDLFFVLSGFLISGTLLDSRGSPSYFQNFYWRRALRILPLYYLAVAVAFWVLRPSVVATEQIWYWLHISNWRTAFQPHLYGRVTHFWSLAIEEQFYLVWPVVVFLCPERRLWKVCVGVILGALVFRNLPWLQTLNSVHQEFLYRLTPSRADALAWGGLVAVIVRSRALSHIRTRLGFVATASLAGLTAVLLITYVRSHEPLVMFSVDSAEMTRVGYFFIDASFACLILWAYLRAGTKAASALRFPLLVSFGKYSYCMYIVHLEMKRLQVPLDGFLSHPLSLLVKVGATYLTAVVSWRLIESRVLRYKDRTPLVLARSIIQRTSAARVAD